MKVELYAIYDTKASYFMTPWPCRNVGIARREFATAVSIKIPLSGVILLIMYCITSGSITTPTVPSLPLLLPVVYATALRYYRLWMEA